MPIQINLLAEQQYAEELRRRDPVKRGYWIAGLVVSLVLVYILFLGLMIWHVQSQVAALKGIQPNQTKILELKANQTSTTNLSKTLITLTNLSTNRFLVGNMLNAMQVSMVDKIQITKIALRQNFDIVNVVKTVNEKKITESSRIEKLKLIVDGKCFASVSEQTINSYIQSIRSNDFFRYYFPSQTNIEPKNISSIQTDLNDATKKYVTFSLECVMPDKAHK